MDRTVERLHASNIRIIMGTPTYSIPAWLFKEHPEIVITKLGGQTISYGLRQNTDLANPTYRFYCERVIRKILEHYKNNQDIIGFQIDNETSSGGAANHDVQGGSEWRARSRDALRLVRGPGNVETVIHFGV
jgi:beta-galactosidase